MTVTFTAIDTDGVTTTCNLSEGNIFRTLGGAYDEIRVHPNSMIVALTLQEITDHKLNVPASLLMGRSVSGPVGFCCKSLAGTPAILSQRLRQQIDFLASSWRKVAEHAATTGLQLTLASAAADPPSVEDVPDFIDPEAWGL